MPRSLRCLFLGLLWLLSGAGCAAGQVPARPEVAVTFDDAPLVRFHSYASQADRALVIDSLTQALHRHGAPATVFAIGSAVQDEASRALLRRWLAAGVDLGNHSFSHPRFDTLTEAEGREEIVRTAEALAPMAAAYGKPMKYFRFPYLVEGAGEADREAWCRVLAEEGLTDARVTLTHDDWKFNEAYARAEAAGDWAARYDIGQAYRDHVLNSVAHWDSLARDLFGRPVRHVILFHVNRINRDYLGEILDGLRDRGFAFISLDEAYTDPLYREPDRWEAPAGTSFLERLKQSRLQTAAAPGG